MYLIRRGSAERRRQRAGGRLRGPRETPPRPRTPAAGPARWTAILSLLSLIAVCLPPAAVLAATDAAGPPPSATVRLAEPEPEAAPERASPDQAAGFIAALGRHCVAILTDGSLTPGQRDRRLRALLRQSFDLGLIARFALGPYWDAADPGQGAEYQRLFGEFLLDLYSARFNRQVIRTFEVLDARAAGRKDALVATRLELSDGLSLGAEWRVRLVDDKPRIIDVTIAGISMALTYRSEFVAFVERHGGALEHLIARLRRSAI